MLLPKAVGSLQALVVLAARSNKLRPAARSLPLAGLAVLPDLRLVDLRFNSKLNTAGPLLAQMLPHATSLVLTPESGNQIRIDRAASALLSRLAAPDCGDVGGGDGGGDENHSDCLLRLMAGHVRRSRLNPAEADATQLRAQLEPHHTGVLRRRLIDDFGRTPAEVRLVGSRCIECAAVMCHTGPFVLDNLELNTHHLAD